jgi:hypothetical protein
MMWYNNWGQVKGIRWGNQQGCAGSPNGKCQGKGPRRMCWLFHPQRQIVHDDQIDGAIPLPDAGGFGTDRIWRLGHP